MWATLGALLTLLGVVVTWWVRDEPRRRREVLLREIVEAEQQAAKALAERDVAGLHLANERLRVLLATLGRLPARRGAARVRDPGGSGGF